MARTARTRAKEKQKAFLKDRCSDWAMEWSWELRMAPKKVSSSVSTKGPEILLEHPRKPPTADQKVTGRAHCSVDYFGSHWGLQ
jgi:hypothetical protein